jgi:hypothetical protein
MIAACVAHPSTVEQLRRLLVLASGLDAAHRFEELALMLRAACEMDALHRTGETIDLVWTGPNPPRSALFRTEQTLLDLIGKGKPGDTLVPREVEERLVLARHRSVTAAVLIRAPAPAPAVATASSPRPPGVESALVRTEHPSEVLVGARDGSRRSRRGGPVRPTRPR